MVLADKQALVDIVRGLVDKFKALFATNEKVNGIANKYYATLSLSGWTSISENGFTYQQTVAVTSPNSSAPAITANSEFLSPAGFDVTTVASTNETLSEALTIIGNGRTVTGDGVVTVKVASKPSCDITVCWTIQA